MTPRLRRSCARALHVVTPDGTVLRAGRASLRVIDALGYGPVARLLSLPPLVWAVEVGYRIVADNRSFFARFILPRHPEAPGDREA